MTIFLNMIIKNDGAYYPSIFLKLENGEEIILSYVQYIHTSPSSVTVSRVNTDLDINEVKTYDNVSWMQILN